MRTSTAYFAGVGTVIFAVGAGLGGGYLAANIAHPPVQTVSKLERRMSAEPIAVSTAPAEPVPYAATPAPATSTPTNSNPAQEQQQAQPHAQPEQAKPQPTQAATPAANTSPAEEKTASNNTTGNNNVAAVAPAPPSPQQTSKAVEQADDRSAAPRESYARAGDTDVKRAAPDKRRAERRQQWTDKRRWKQPREQQLRDQELDVVEERVREATEPRRIRIREEGEPRGFFGEVGRRDIFAEPARSETPRIRLFDQDD
jgi:hypothetical protein